MSKEHPASPSRPETPNQQEAFRRKLEEILQTSVSVENIDRYADTVLERLIELTEEVTESYQGTGLGTEALTDDALENAAYEHFGLSSIGDALEQAQEIEQNLTNIQWRIQTTNAEQPAEYLIPPKARPLPLGNGENEFAPNEIIPRLKTLLFLLQSDCGLDPEEVSVTRGDVDTRWFRAEPYYRVEIPALERVVYVCEEEGNASYVFDTQLLELVDISVELLNKSSKEDLKALIAEMPGIGMRVIQAGQWRAEMASLLMRPIPPLQEEAVPDSEVYKASTRDLDPWKGFYTDGEGKHWASGTKLGDYLGFSKDTINEEAQGAGLRQILVNSYGVSPAYCLEEVLELDKIKKTRDLPRAESSGEWAGFYIDKEGRHWGSIKRVLEKIFAGENVEYLWGKVTESNPARLAIFVRTKKTDAVCLEEVRELPAIQQYLESAAISKDDPEWKNFMTDKAGQHWGSVRAIAARLSCSKKTIQAIVDSHPDLETKALRLGGEGSTGYKFEEIIELPETKRLIEAPFAEKEGEWKDFYCAEDGSHWGGMMVITTKLGLSRYRFYALINKHQPEAKDIRDSHGLTQGYRLEDFREYLQLPD